MCLVFKDNYQRRKRNNTTRSSNDLSPTNDRLSPFRIEMKERKKNALGLMEKETRRRT